MRSVPLAIEGRLTTRQRDFVTAMMTLSTLTLVAISATSASMALIGGGVALFCVGRVAWLIAGDRKSADPIFRLPDPPSSAATGGNALDSGTSSTQRAIHNESEDPTRRLT